MSERRGVPAAEKYAELLANGQERPLCACHQETMMWCKDQSCCGGGLWRCSVKHGERCRRDLESNREKRKKAKRRWREANTTREREYSRKYWEANPEKRAANNASRIMVGGMYLGTFRFTQTEVEAMLSGTSD